MEHGAIWFKERLNLYIFNDILFFGYHYCRLFLLRASIGMRSDNYKSCAKRVSARRRHLLANLIENRQSNAIGSLRDGADVDGSNEAANVNVNVDLAGADQSLTTNGPRQ